MNSTIANEGRITLSARELATVLAGLRLHQRLNVEGRKSFSWDEISRIASDNGTCEPLRTGEIDALCIRINFGCEADASF